MLKVAGGIIIAIIILTVVVPLTCGLCVVGTGVAVNQEVKSYRVEKKTVAASRAPTGTSVMYRDKCNVRTKPSSRGRVITQTSTTAAYPVLKSKGKWKQIMINGQKGWAGCQDTR